MCRPCDIGTRDRCGGHTGESRLVLGCGQTARLEPLVPTISCDTFYTRSYPSACVEIRSTHGATAILYGYVRLSGGAVNTAAYIQFPVFRRGDN